MHAGNRQAFGEPEIATSSRLSGAIGSGYWWFRGFKPRRRWYQQLWRSGDRTDGYCTSCQRNVASGRQPDWDDPSGERNFSPRRQPNRERTSCQCNFYPERHEHDRNVYSNAGQYDRPEHYFSQQRLTGKHNAGQHHDSGHQHDNARHDNPKHYDAEHDRSKYVSFNYVTRHDSSELDPGHIAQHVAHPDPVLNHGNRQRDVGMYTGHGTSAEQWLDTAA